MALKFAPGSREYLRTLAPRPRRDMRATLRLIEEDPRHPKLDLRLLRVKAGFRIFRAKVGEYRIVFSPRAGRTDVFRLQHRSEGYDWLDRLFP